MLLVLWRLFVFQARFCSCWYWDWISKIASLYSGSQPRMMILTSWGRGMSSINCRLITVDWRKRSIDMPPCMHVWSGLRTLILMVWPADLAPCTHLTVSTLAIFSPFWKWKLLVSWFLGDNEFGAARLEWEWVGKDEKDECCKASLEFLSCLLALLLSFLCS